MLNNIKERKMEMKLMKALSLRYHMKRWREKKFGRTKTGGRG